MRSDTSITTDIDTDDEIRSQMLSHSRSHTISNMELDCEVARLKKRKVYHKKKGQACNFSTPKSVKIKGYLSPTVSGKNMTKLIECSDAIKSQHTEVGVILQETCAIIKTERAEEVSGKYWMNIMNTLFVCH